MAAAAAAAGSGEPGPSLGVPDGYEQPVDRNFSVPLEAPWRYTVELGSFWREPDDAMLLGHGAWGSKLRADPGALVTRTPLPSTTWHEDFATEWQMVEQEKKGGAEVSINLLFFKIRFRFGATVSQSSLKVDVHAARRFDSTACMVEPKQAAYPHLDQERVKEALRAGATHIVTGITYGHRAYLEMKGKVDMHKAHASLRSGNFVEKIGSKAILGILGGGGRQGRPKELVEDDVVYAGDVLLASGVIVPKDFESGSAFAQKLPGYIAASLEQTQKEHGVPGVPQHVYLTPLHIVADKGGLTGAGWSDLLRATVMPKLDPELLVTVDTLSMKAVAALDKIRELEADPAVYLVEAMFAELGRARDGVRGTLQEDVGRIRALVAAARVDISGLEELKAGVTKATGSGEGSLQSKIAYLEKLNTAVEQLHAITDPADGLAMESSGSPHVDSVDLATVMDPAGGTEGTLVIAWSMDAVMRLLARPEARVVVLLRLQAPFNTAATDAALRDLRGYVAANAESKHTLGVVVVESVTSAVPQALLTVHHFSLRPAGSMLPPPPREGADGVARVAGPPRVEEVFVAPRTPVGVEVGAVERFSCAVTWGLMPAEGTPVEPGTSAAFRGEVPPAFEVRAERIKASAGDDSGGGGLEVIHVVLSADDAALNATQLSGFVAPAAAVASAGGSHAGPAHAAAARADVGASQPNESQRWGVMLRGLKPSSGYTVSVRAADLHGCGGSAWVPWGDLSPIDTRGALPAADTIEYKITGHESGPAAGDGAIRTTSTADATRARAAHTTGGPLELVIKDADDTSAAAAAAAGPSPTRIIRLNSFERRMLLDLNTHVGLHPDFSDDELRALRGRTIVLDAAYCTTRDDRGGGAEATLR